MVSPLVAVTGRALQAGRVARWPEPALALQRTYLDAISRAGGTPVLLLPEELDERDASALLARFDALVLTGGPDVEPACYGQERHPDVYGVDAVADAFECALLRAALASDIRTLAICRGIQVLNVALGGTLHQHITGAPGVGAHGVPAVDDGSVLHEVVLDAGSRTADVMGTVTPTCSSHHHQALDALGAGVTVVGRAADGIVEAVEVRDAPHLLAVQWHPEDTAATDPAQQRLFDWLVSRD
ncbi:MAG TPA: gamma-glutamyl-gamma-aminobutyrate hydrolase family protein [Acidimicrobiia bacterium]|nr:gamma-glutamyl-gamma-aminobutyrate hydrolase family protein [Acidimicrobiia bacterium]